MTDTVPLAVEPDWYRPKGAGTEHFPAIWFDWLLHWTPRNAPADPRSRLLWYPGSRGVRASWVLLPQIPIYRAHRLAGWPSARRTPDSEGIRDLTDLVWQPAPEPADELVGVWPNRVQVSAKGDILAVPSTSHIARGHREDAEGLPILARSAASTLAGDAGSFHVFLLDGHYRQHTAAARRTKALGDPQRRQQFLHDYLKLGPSGAVTALPLSSGAWLVLCCRYPDAIRALAPDITDRTRLPLLRTLLAVVLRSALPGLELHRDDGADTQRAALASNLRREILHGLGLEAKAATAANIATALIPDTNRGQRLLTLLAKGWKNDPAAISLKEWPTTTLESPLNRALIPLTQLLGSRPDDEAQVAAVRHWVLQQIADGIDDRLVATLAQAEDDPTDDRSLMHWVVLLGIALLHSRLSPAGAVSTR